MTMAPRTRAARRVVAAALAVTTASAGAAALDSDFVPAAQAAPCPALWNGSTSGSIGTPFEIGLAGAYQLASQTGSLDVLANAVTGNPVPWFSGRGGYYPEISGRTQTVQLVTGRTSPNRTAERFGITGTDLGIMWDNGRGEILMALGDTMGNCLGDSQWRSNVLFRSNNRDLHNGFAIASAPMDGAGMARSVLPRTNLPGERTVIPTAGIEVGGKQYMRYMSVVNWDQPGEWHTNYSALAVSEDNGETWRPLPRTFRIGHGNNPHLIPPESTWTEEVTRVVPEAEAPPVPPVAVPGAPVVTKLPPEEGAEDAEPMVEVRETVTHTPPKMPQGQMSAFLKADGFVYEYLTPSGRQGDARVARVPEGEIENPLAYEYWDGKDWNRNFDAAAPVMPAKVSEMSVGYNSYLGRYIALYTNGANNIVMRQAERPEGPWSGEDVLLSSKTLPSIYGAYIHPWSLNSRELYFTLSTWDAYNVFLMRTDLDTVRRAEITGHNTPDPADTGEAVVVNKTPLPGF